MDVLDDMLIIIGVFSAIFIASLVFLVAACAIAGNPVSFPWDA